MQNIEYRCAIQKKYCNNVAYPNQNVKVSLKIDHSSQKKPHELNSWGFLRELFFVIFCFFFGFFNFWLPPHHHM